MGEGADEMFDRTEDLNDARVSKPHLFEGKWFVNNTQGMKKWHTSKEAIRAYTYVTPEDELPDLYATEQESDPLVRVKLFDPTGSWTWYLTEFDGVEQAFGYTIGHEGELGYISLTELAHFRGRMGLPIERDLHWTPRKLSEVRK